MKQYNVHATFFLVGKNAERYPDLVKAHDRRRPRGRKSQL
ncbi:MAG: polysaccharide deacetylase family protein [Clostridia bacterium]